jgi:hypothetical protein
MVLRTTSGKARIWVLVLAEFQAYDGPQMETTRYLAVRCRGCGGVHPIFPAPTFAEGELAFPLELPSFVECPVNGQSYYADSENWTEVFLPE